ncbi:MAG TPA: hypothetical protein VMT52_14250, partial [Planctomycetota bacterium]|nr:hypothetical protein [Planctomycetota bacterium]
MTASNRYGWRRRAWPLSAAASLSTTLVLVSCAPATIPVIDPLPPPPPGADVRTGDQFLAPPVPREIGKLPEAPQPRFGAALFEYPRSGPGSTAQHSPVRTAELANRLELSRLFARAIRLESSPVIEAGADLSSSGARLAAEPDAKGVDILVSGTILSGGNTEVRLVAHDTRDGRLVARSEFEGGDPGAVLDRA